MHKQSKILATIQELPIPPRKQLPPYKLNHRLSETFKAVFPSALIAIKQLKYSNKSFPYSLFPGKSLCLLRKRRMLPYFSSGWLQTLCGLNLSKLNGNIWLQRRLHFFRSLTLPSVPSLNRILKEAKNLKSLALESMYALTNFKRIRKARGLQDLSLKITTKPIMAFPQLFKHLTSLQRVNLDINQFRFENEIAITSKFFGFLLNLPKLQHLTVWLDDSFYFYKTLLCLIHAKKLPSFHVKVRSSSEPPKCVSDWGKCLETLWIDSRPYFPVFSHTKIPERRLSLNRHPKIDDFINKGFPIKNLEIYDLVFCQGRPSIWNLRKIFTLISQAQTLESLTLSFETPLTGYSKICNAFHQEFSEIKTLENLKAFTFALVSKNKGVPMTSPPESSKMKNLKSLVLILMGQSLNFSDYTQALKSLASLEKFEFIYVDSNVYDEISCNFPFQGLQNLELITISCSNPFSESSINQLVQSVSQLENLKKLRILGRILFNMEKAMAVAKSLHSNKSLEIISFEENVQNGRLFVNMQKVNGGWAASFSQNLI